MCDDGVFCLSLSCLQDTELKVAILDLVTECVVSQPGMMELFLSVRPKTASNSGDKDGAVAKTATPEVYNVYYCPHTLVVSLSLSF